MEFCSSLPGLNNLQNTLNVTVKIISEIPAVWWVIKSVRSQATWPWLSQPVAFPAGLPKGGNTDHSCVGL